MSVSKPRLGRSALAVAFACASACGGSRPTAQPTLPPPPTTTLPPPPTRLSDLSATVTSPEANQRILCRNNVTARVVVTSRGPNAVPVLGIRRTGEVTDGRCIGGAEFTYAPRVASILPGSDTVVMDRQLYNSNGSGCCNVGCSGTICQIELRFEVNTELGAVPAGSFKYEVRFSDCVACSGVTSSVDAGGCPPESN